MANDFTVIVLDRFTSEPKAYVTVEARDADTGLAIELQQTDIHGVASFANLATNNVSFHARVSDPLYQVSVPHAGLGPFGYDYLIDANWATVVAAGGGTEGQSFTTFHGHTFKIYSTIGGAVTDANTNRQTLAQSSSFFIAAGDYTVSTQITLTPPTSGSYNLFGAGMDSVTITGTMSSGALFLISPSVLDSMVDFQNLELVTTAAINLIQGSLSCRASIDNCFLRPINVGATAISPRSTGVAGWNISNTSIEGTGKGIASSGTVLLLVRLTNCFIQTATGIELGEQGFIECDNVRFECSTRDISITANVSSLALLLSNCEFHKGIRFSGTPCWFSNFVVSGCLFFLGSGEVGIDYSGATAALSLLDCRGHSLVGNSFFGAGTAIGIRGGSATAAGPTTCTVVGNTFISFTAGNEIIDMDRAADGNNVAHNATDSGTVLPDTGHSHKLLSTTHTDTLPDDVVDGSIVIGNVTPKWSRLGISIPVANVRNVLGIDNGDLRPSWKTTLDSTAPTTIAPGDVAASGTSLVYSHRDHLHGAPSTYPATAHNILSATHGDTLAASVVDGDVMIGNVTPKWSRLAIAIPAANVRNALGIDNGELRPSWKTSLDATAPVDVAAAASAGTSLVYSHRDHVHAHGTGYLPDAHHSQSHVLATTAGLGVDHTTSGLTAGQMLLATAGTTAAFVAMSNHATLAGSGAITVTNHSQIVGTSDLHTEYFKLAGRSGGQTAQGDTALGGNLTLMSTAHATKGSTYIGSSSLFAFNETAGQLALPTTGIAAGLLLGGDALLCRVNANELQTGTGDNLYVLDGLLSVGIAPTVNAKAFASYVDNDPATGTFRQAMRAVMTSSIDSGTNSFAIGGMGCNLTIQGTTTHSGTMFGADYLVQIAGSVTKTGQPVTGARFLARITGSATSSAQPILGGDFIAQVNSTTAVFSGASELLGGRFSVNNAGAFLGTIPTARAALFTALSFTSACTVTTAVMLDVAAWPAGPTYTRGPYGIVQRGAADINEINGPTRFGNVIAAPTETTLPAQVLIDTTAANPVLRLTTAKVSTTDKPQETVLQGDVKTTDATVTTVLTIAIPASTTVHIEVHVTARRTGGAAGTAEDGAGYVIDGTYKTVAGVVTLIGALGLGYTAEDQALWNASLVISGTNVIVQVTGAALNNVSWVCTARVWPVGS